MDKFWGKEIIDLEKFTKKTQRSSVNKAIYVRIVLLFSFSVEDAVA